MGVELAGGGEATLGLLSGMGEPLAGDAFPAIEGEAAPAFASGEEDSPGVVLTPGDAPEAAPGPLPAAGEVAPAARDGPVGDDGCVLAAKMAASAAADGLAFDSDATEGEAEPEGGEGAAPGGEAEPEGALVSAAKAAAMIAADGLEEAGEGLEAPVPPALGLDPVPTENQIESGPQQHSQKKEN